MANVQMHPLVCLPLATSRVAAMRASEEIRAEVHDDDEKDKVRDQVKDRAKDEAKGKGKDQVKDRAKDEVKDIRQTLWISANTVYTHEKLSKRFHRRAQSGDNPLPVWLCMLRGHLTPDPRHALQTGQLRDAPPLPLVHWECMYLALAAEIYWLRKEVLGELNTEAADAKLLHTFGQDATKDNTPFLMTEFALQLEHIWSWLMSESPRRPLDKAVRKERVKIILATNPHENFDEEWNRQELSEQAIMLKSVSGMLDPATTPLDTIFRALNDKQPLVRRACLEQTNNERLLPTRPAVAQEMDPNAEDTGYFGANAPGEERRSRERSTDYFTPQAPDGGTNCLCVAPCLCRKACEYEIHACRCRTAEGQPNLYSSHPTYYEGTDSVVSNGMAQMHISPTAMRAEHHAPLATHASPTAMRAEPHAPLATHAAQLTGSEAAPRLRQRANANRSNLIYVPDAPSSEKDAYPLRLYHERHSGQRYPNINRSDTGQLSPEHNPSGQNLPSRGPLPSPLAAVPRVVLAEGFQAEPRNQVPSSRIRKDTRDVEIPCPAIAPSTGNSYNLRGTEYDFGGWDTSHVATPVLAPLEQGNPIAEESRTVTPPPSQIPRNLPLPAFIAPQPGSRQRYVLAGGNARLQDRPEIPGFQLPTALDRGLSLTKEKPEQESARKPDATGHKRGRTTSSLNSRISHWKRVLKKQNSTD